MKKNKKIIAITLSIVLGVVALLSAVPIIMLSLNKVEGTDAAKMLLARENMSNASTSFDWENLFTETTAQISEQAVQPVNVISSGSNQTIKPMTYFLSNKSTSLGTLVHDSPAGKVYKNNGKYNFQDISGASYQGAVVESRLESIDFRVENAAKNIDFLKNELNIVDKWVKKGYSKFYLNVTSNKETLFEYYEDKSGQKSLWVVERETREDANSVYSLMYTDMHTGKINNPTYLVYIPNERYEYYYGHEGNSTDCLIAEQDKGYWNVFMPEEDDYENLIISDDFAFQSFGEYSSTNNVYSRISTTDLKEDIISHYDNGISIHLSALNGINGIYVPEEYSSVETYDGGEKSYITVPFDHTDKIEVQLDNGKILSTGDEFVYSEGTVKIFETGFDFFTNPGFADPQYNVSFTLEMGEGLSLKEKLSLFETFLNDNNLTCKYDLDELEKCILKNSEISNTLTSFYTWNGYLINSSENFESAKSVIFAKMDEMFSEYEAVKNAEQVNQFFSARLARNQAFAKISGVNIESANYSDGKIQINNVSVAVEKSNLLEENKGYKLQVGLARIDKDGNYLSQNTVHLTTANTVNSEVYNGSALTLSATGEYDIPLALEENRYVVVVYAVTDDELIRVSEMKSIGFIDTVNDTIETSFVNINIESVDGNLIVEYSTKLYFNITVNGDITYEALRKNMMSEALKCGYPMENEEIHNLDGDLITQGPISPGEYKLKFAISTLDGVVTGYVVCTVLE